MYYKRRPWALKKKDNPDQLYRKNSSWSNDLMYELVPIDKYLEPTGPKFMWPNYHYERLSDSDATKDSFESKRPKAPLVPPPA